MEDVSRRLVTQMAACIKAQVEAPEAPAAAEGEASASAGAATGAAEPPAAGPVTSAPPQAAKPVNALSLLFSVLWDRIKRLFGRR
jgi:hypothetical protein